MVVNLQFSADRRVYVCERERQVPQSRFWWDLIAYGATLVAQTVKNLLRCR